MAAKLMDLIEGGLDPEQIIQHFKNEDEKKAIEDIEGDDSDEVFPDEVLIISQALAYRDATVDDVSELHKLLSAAYSPEVAGSEAFRTGDAVGIASVQDSFRSGSFRWLVVEAPSGKGIELDGVILGAVCYSVDGVARKDGVIEGTLGSIRFIGVLPRYHGFCVGRRLLERAEANIFKEGCCKVMVCIPSTRTSAMDWAERRGYTEAGYSLYPAAGLGHTLKKSTEEVQLVRFVKSKDSVPVESTSKDQAPSGAWHLKSRPCQAMRAANSVHNSKYDTTNAALYIDKNRAKGNVPEADGEGDVDIPDVD